jgi:hypothetical protein
MGVRLEVFRQPTEYRFALYRSGSEGERDREVWPLEDVVAICEKSLQQANEPWRSRREGCAKEVRDPLGDLLRNDQWLHGLVSIGSVRLLLRLCPRWLGMRPV